MIARTSTVTRQGPAEGEGAACPRCGRAGGLLLARPPGPFNSVYRCAGHGETCGYLWSPRADAL